MGLEFVFSFLDDDGVFSKSKEDGVAPLRDNVQVILDFPRPTDCKALQRFLGMMNCAAKALFSCPAIISQRLESRILSNEPLENTEEESKII
jgi:hypothetical protein